jgi:DNA-binding MarR family transcriptional regulator
MIANRDIILSEGNIRYNDIFFKVIFTRSAIGGEGIIANNKHVNEQVNEEVSGQVSKSDEQVNKQALEILKALNEEEKSKSTLLDAIGLTSAYGNYIRHIAPLVEKGYIEMTIPGKPTSSAQKYRLTEIGRSLI